MSNKIDERIVELKFNTKQFEQGVKSTQDNLDKLNDALKMEGASQGLEEVANSVGNIEKKFSILGAIGLTAIMKLTEGAIGFGQKIAGAVLDPLIQGGKKRAQNIEQAKFQFKGLGMDVEQSMADALFAVKGTSYGLDEAAVAASQFGASGIKSGTEMQTALRGIAGVAAMAGSSYTDMSNVFTKVAGQGRVMGDDLNRLGTRGINAASTLADYLNKTGQAANATEADVRSMVTKGEIDFKTFSAAMSDAFGEHATKASETYAGSLSNLRAALGRVGEMYYTPKMEQSRKLFISLTRVVDELAEGFKPLIAAFMEFTNMGNDSLIAMLDGLNFTDFINGMSLISEAMKLVAVQVDRVIRPIQLAFQDVFGGEQVKIFTNLGTALLDFAKSLNVSYSAGIKIREVFTSIFAVLKNVIAIVTSVGRVIFAVFGAAARVIGAVASAIFEFFGFLKPLAGVFGQTGGEAKSFAQKLSEVTDIIVDAINNGVEPLIKGLNWLRDTFNKLITVPVKGFFENVGIGVNGANTFAEILGLAIKGIGDAVSGMWALIEPIFGKIGSLLKQLSGAFENFNFNALFAGINTGILAMLASGLMKLFGGGSDALEAVQDLLSFKDSIMGIFEEVTGVLKAMQNDLNAQALMKLAAAIGILALSMLILSTIDGGSMATSAAGMASMVAMLVGATIALEKFVTLKGAAKLPFIIATLIALASAVLMMSLALKLLSTIPMDKMLTGLLGLGVGLAAMAGAMLLMSLVGPKVLFAAAAIGAVAGALVVMAVALKLMGSMSLSEMAIGMGGLVVGLAAMTGAMLLLSQVGPKLLFAIPAILAMSFAIVALAGAVKIMGSMSLSEMAIGLGGLVVGLAAMSGAMLLLSLVGPRLLIAIPAMLALALTVTALAGALKILGSMSLSEMAVAMGGLVVALAAMTGAMLLLGMVGPIAIVGAAAILVVALALTVLVGAIAVLAGMDMASLAQGVIALTVVLGVMIGAMLLLGVVGPLAMLGAAAILVMATALAVVTAVLIALGSVPSDVISQGIGAIAGALGVLIGLGTALGLLSPILIAGGVALLVLAAGLVVAGAGMILMALAVAIFAGAAPTAANALSALGAAIAGAVIYIPAMLLLGGALLIFGAGAIVGGAGALVLGAGLIVLSAGLALVGVSAPMGAAGLSILAASVVQLTPLIIEFIAVGAGMIALGAGLLVLGAGALVAGAGLLVFGAGMALMATVGPRGAQALEQVVEKIAGLAGHALKLGVMTVALAALGVALLATGAGALLSMAGLMGTATALMMLLSVYPGAVAGLKAVDAAVVAAAANVGMMAALSAGLISLGSGFASVASSGRSAASGITALVTSSNSASAAVRMLGVVVTSMIPQAIAIFRQLGPATQQASNQVQSSMRTLSTSVTSAVGPTSAAARALASALINTLVATIGAGRGRVYASSFAVGMAVSQGMAVGIRANSGIVTAAADQVAAQALAASKARLGVKSPSREYAKIGMWSDRGLAKGMIDNVGEVTTASENVADSALTAMAKAMARAGEAIFEEMDTTPTIRPVLDLSDVSREAASLGGMLKVPALSTAGAYANAAQVSAEIRESRDIREGLQDAPRSGVTEVKLTQNNYSPKALSATDIYRNTKSLVATAKEVGSDDNRGTSS